MTLLTTAPIAKKISSVHEYYTSKNYMSTQHTKPTYMA